MLGVETVEIERASVYTEHGGVFMPERDDVDYERLNVKLPKHLVDKLDAMRAEFGLTRSGMLGVLIAQAPEPKRGRRKGASEPAEGERE